MSFRRLPFALLPFLIACAHGASRPPRLEIGFETAGELGAVRARGADVTLCLDAHPAGVHEGKSSLALDVQDAGAGRQAWPSIDVTLPEPVDLAAFQAIECWVHVPEDASRHLFGRHDARIFINGDKPMWARPALAAGWTLLRWELRNLHAFPQTRTLTLQFGPLLPGFGTARLHLDQLVFVPMAPLAETAPERLGAVAADPTLPWTDRFQALRTLEPGGTVREIPRILTAAADGPADEGFNPTRDETQPAYILRPTVGSEAVRSAARATLLTVARRAVKSGEAALVRDALETALNQADGRIRLAATQTLAQLEDEAVSNWTQAALERALLDDLYYVREQALLGLRRRGLSKAEIAVRLAGRLTGSDLPTRQPAVRALSELGSPAQSALPAVLAILRNPEEPLLLRRWCLRAAWWTDESVLRPEDWVLALGLKPGEVHRHLLNRAMDRLHRAGPSAVPALATALRSPDPEVRARTAVLLREAGDSARALLETAAHDPVWYVRASAGSSEPAPPAETGPVQVKRESGRILFDNGVVQIGFAESGRDPGPTFASLKGGPNLLDSGWLYDLLSFKDTQSQAIIERAWFQKVHGVALNKELTRRLGRCDANQAEFVFTYPANATAPLEWEFHYIVRRGAPGFYSYLAVRNTTDKELPDSTTTQSAGSTGMLLQLVAPTWGLFETGVLHDRLKGPAALVPRPDFDGYPDIYQASYRLPDGEVDAKHEGGNHELPSPVIGYCGPAGGFWQITPSLEYSGGSWPFDQKTGLNHNLFVFSLENKYYVPTSPRITPHWSKLYGPIFHYLNRGGTTEEMWTDAKRRAAAEMDAWPYAWLDRADYRERGTVTGRVSITHGHDPHGAWVLLALPEEVPEGVAFGAWWRDTGRYHYAAQTRADGSFTVPQVQPGSYSLFVWKPGVFGEARVDGLVVSAGGRHEVGPVVLEPLDRGRLVWQVGEADRGVTEFRNGGNFHQWDTYLRYRDDFPRDVHFEIGRSVPDRDWNYLQPAVAAGESAPTAWRIGFTFDPNVPGEPVLTVVAGGRGAELEVTVNDEPVGTLKIDGIGLQHIRTVPNGELVTRTFPFRRELLRPGRNEVAFRFQAGRGGAANWTRYVAYDFVRLELR